MKVFCILLTATLLFLLPWTVFAAEGDGDTADVTEQIAVAETMPQPASVPDNLENIWKTLSPGYYQPTVLPLRGRAMFYNPDIMQRVLNFRLQAGHVTACPDCVGYVAMLRRGDLDRRVWLQREGQTVDGPFWVIDAADRNHVGSLLARGWVVDVDHETALRWGIRRPVAVTIWGDLPLGSEVVPALTLAQRAAGVTDLGAVEVDPASQDAPNPSLIADTDSPLETLPDLGPPRLP